MKNSKILAILSLAFLIVGCGTKREYFEPNKNEVKDIKYSGQIASSIAEATISGATLQNGNIISKDAVNSKIKLAKGDRFLGKFEDLYLVSNLDGNFKILDEENGVKYQNKFPQMIVAASVGGEKLAAVGSQNKIYLIDFEQNKTLLTEQVSQNVSQDSRAANPYFMPSLVIFPTLDGRILIVDKARNFVFKDFVVSDEQFFNNIIFLDIQNENMVAATATKLILIKPDGIKTINEQIKNVAINDDKIYLFLKDGLVKIFDFNLNLVKEKLFRFAIFASVGIKDGKIFIIEKTGYLIKTDLNLESEQIYALDSQIDQKSFMGNDNFYYDNRVLKLD